MARGKVYTTAPLLYNDQGDPIPQYLDVSDKTDSPQGSFKPLTNDPQDVRLTGSIVIDAAVERQTISDNIEFVKVIPDNVIGALIHARVRSLTGNFSENEGISVRVTIDTEYPSGGYYYIFDMQTQPSSLNTSFHSFVFQQNMDNIGDLKDNLGNMQHLVSGVNLSLFNNIRVRVNVSGEEVEADVEAFIKWVF